MLTTHNLEEVRTCPSCGADGTPDENSLHPMIWEWDLHTLVSGKEQEYGNVGVIGLFVSGEEPDRASIELIVGETRRRMARTAALAAEARAAAAAR